MELATFRAGAAPTVNIVSPAGGETWQGKQKVRWTTTGGQPVFTVQYSPDGGTSWLPLSEAVSALEYEFETNEIVGGNDVRFRVIASSGIDTASATSNAVRVPQNAQLTLAARA